MRITYFQGKIKSWLPPLIFGSGLLFSAFLCFFLPETMNCELPETIEDSENFGKLVQSNMILIILFLYFFK